MLTLLEQRFANSYGLVWSRHPERSVKVATVRARERIHDPQAVNALIA